MDDTKMWCDCIFGIVKDRKFYCDYHDKMVRPQKCKDCIAYCDKTNARYIVRKYIETRNE